MKSILFFQSALNGSNMLNLSGVKRYARSAGWNLHVVPYAAAAYSRGNSNEYCRPDVLGMIRFWKADGVIADCGMGDGLWDPREVSAVPVVYLDRVPTGKETCVSAEAKSVAAMAARELLSLGFQTYAYVPFSKRLPWSVERGEEFFRLIRMNGYKCHVFRKRPFGDDAETYRAWLCEWLKKAPKPLGLFAANDRVAEVVLSCAEREHIAVPDELSVIGVDNDIPICEQATPTLTSILLDNEQAGFLAARLLNEKMLHPRRKISNGFFGALCICHRQSTFIHARRDDRIATAVQHIRQKACNGLTAKAVIAEMGCSRRLAELRFREVRGHSILEEILAVRIEHAKTLLEHSFTSVDEIAKACGYGSANALRNVFSATTGMTPNVWRRKFSG